MSEPVVVGLDLGTTKAKGAAFDLRGTPLAAAERAIALHRPRTGWAEQDPEQWWAATQEILRSLAGAVGGERIAAVGIVSQVNTHVPVDGGLRPLCPAITWQDVRCSGVAAELDAALDADGRRALGGEGFRVDASYLPARRAWLARERPDVHAATRWMLSPKDFVNARLTGEVASDPVSSIGLAGADGAYLGRLDELLVEVGDVLPPLSALDAPLGRVLAEAGTGLPASAAVAVGTMDAWGNLFGSGVVHAGEGMEVAGTSEIVGVLGRGGPGAPGVVSFHPYAGLELHAGPTQAGGAGVRWFADSQGLSIEALLREAAGAPAGGDGVVFLPHLLGERAPLWNPDARGVLFGLRLDHGRAALCRAALEGVAFSARQLFEAVCAAAGATPAALRASGGGAASDLWCQVKADALGVALQRVRVRDSGVLGAALIGAVSAGLLPDLAAAAGEMVRVEREFVPDAAGVAALERGYETYRRVQEALWPVFAEVADGS